MGNNRLSVKQQDYQVSSQSKTYDSQSNTIVNEINVEVVTNEINQVDVSENNINLEMIDPGGPAETIFHPDFELVGDVIGGSGTTQIQTDLAEVNASPGNYEAATINVDGKGRILTASSNRIPRETTYTVQSDGENEWTINAIANQLYAVFINQLDYATFCAIDPPGSGVVVYNENSGGYTTQKYDKVRILWK